MASLDQLLDSGRVDEISARARQVDVGRVLLTLIAAIFYSVGWTAGKALLAVAWCAVAVKVGFQEARKPTGGGRGSA